MVSKVNFNTYGAGISASYLLVIFDFLRLSQMILKIDIGTLGIVLQQGHVGNEYKR